VLSVDELFIDSSSTSSISKRKLVSLIRLSSNMVLFVLPGGLESTPIFFCSVFVLSCSKLVTWSGLGRNSAGRLHFLPSKDEDDIGVPER